MAMRLGEIAAVAHQSACELEVAGLGDRRHGMVDRKRGELRAVEGDVLVFSSSHFLRVVGARWLGLDASAGRYFLLSTAALSIVGYEHDLAEPAFHVWNDCRHAGD